MGGQELEGKRKPADIVNLMPEPSTMQRKGGTKGKD